MKKFAFALIAVFALNFNLFAVNLPVINKIDNHSFVLDISDWKSETISVTITDKYDVVVYSETTNANVAIRKYNMSNLPAGNYTFSVEDNTKTVSQNIAVYYDHIDVSTNTSKTFKPKFETVDGKIALNYLSKGIDFDFSIVDHNNEVVYTKNINKMAAVHKTFDINALKSGKYTAIVNTDNEMFAYDFVK